MQDVQGIQPNIPTSTTFIEIYNHDLWYVRMFSLFWYVQVPRYVLGQKCIPRSVQEVRASTIELCSLEEIKQ